MRMRTMLTRESLLMLVADCSISFVSKFRKLSFLNILQVNWIVFFVSVLVLLGGRYQWTFESLDDIVSHFLVLIVRTATVVSDVWEYFEKNAEAKKVKFCLCSKQLIFHKGTTNLHKHLQKVHSLCYKKAKVKQWALMNFCDLDSVANHAFKRSLAAVRNFEGFEGSHGKGSKVKFQPLVQP